MSEMEEHAMDAHKAVSDTRNSIVRWGKPHVASLSFHSLLNLRVCLEHCALMLDLEANDLPSVVYRVVEELSVMGRLEETQKPHILRYQLQDQSQVESIMSMKCTNYS